MPFVDKMARTFLSSPKWRIRPIRIPSINPEPDKSHHLLSYPIALIRPVFSEHLCRHESSR